MPEKHEGSPVEIHDTLMPYVLPGTLPSCLTLRGSLSL